MRYNKLNQSTLQNYIIRDMERGRPNFSLQDFVKHIVVRTVDFIEDPFKAGLEQQCFEMYSSEIASLVSIILHLANILLRQYSPVKSPNATKISRTR